MCCTRWSILWTSRERGLFPREKSYRSSETDVAMKGGARHPAVLRWKIFLFLSASCLLYFPLCRVWSLRLILLSAVVPTPRPPVPLVVRALVRGGSVNTAECWWRVRQGRGVCCFTWDMSRGWLVRAVAEKRSRCGTRRDFSVVYLCKCVCLVCLSV